jgi:hypothetical protein
MNQFLAGKLLFTYHNKDFIHSRGSKTFFKYLRLLLGCSKSKVAFSKTRFIAYGVWEKFGKTGEE